MAEEVVLDEKGRILIPKNIRDRLGFHERVRLRLVVEDDKIMITRTVSPEEFIGRMEGCIRNRSPIPKVDPLRLKEIWEKT
jgi:AbrB family looped-hinge helix DNA binding protein